MLSNTVVDRDTVLAVFDEYDAVCEKLAALTFSAMTLPDLLELQSRREVQARRAPAVDHRLLAEAQSRTTAREIGAKNWADVLAIRLRISKTDAKRRVADAALLGPRTATTGQPLRPVLPATAAAQAAGQINTDHVAVIDKFFDKCPIPLDARTRQQIDDDLAAIASGNSPDILKRCADRLTFLLNQDGPEPPESVQERRRGIEISPQGLDGLSKVHGYLDAETAATFHAIQAKLAAPGMCNRADENPCVAGTPSAEAIATDTRSAAQRTHDAFLAMGRALLASGQLGQHNGLPVSVVISTSVRELESLAGVATTGSGTRLSIPQVIGMAAHARHYLAVFANHTEVPLYLGRSKRIASVGQRIVLHARDRGCTKPGCPNPPDRCQGHHGELDFAKGGQTDITGLALACPSDNRLVHDQGWTTHIRADGRVEWIPPPLLDTGQDRLNHYWRPEDLFHPNEEANDDARGDEARDDLDLLGGGAAEDAGDALLPDIAPEDPSGEPKDPNREPEDLAHSGGGAAEDAGGEDVDDTPKPDLEPEDPNAEPEELLHSGGEATTDAGHTPKSNLQWGGHLDAAQGPGNRDGLDDP